MGFALRTQELGLGVTSRMRTDAVRVPDGSTVAEALAEVRRQRPEGRIIYFYVVDAAGKLKGVIPTRRLLLSDPGDTVSRVMIARVVSIPADATVLEACEFFLLHKFLAFPVVDRQGVLLGVVDIDLYTQQRGDLETRDEQDSLFQLIGVHFNRHQKPSAVRGFRERFPWLIANIVGGILAAVLTGFYEHQLRAAVELALFIPVVLTLAEAVAIQAVSLTTQRLHGEPATWKSLSSALRVEGLTTLLIGAGSALIVGAVVGLWIGKGPLVATVCLGIVCGVVVAGLVGTLIPMLLRLLKRDPQVASGPVSLAIADMLTLLAYFNIAKWLLA